MMKTVEMIEKQLREYIGNDMEREKWDIAAHDCLAKLLAEKWECKKLNARIADQFKERFIPAEVRSKTTVYYSKENGMCNLIVWGIGPYTDYSKRIMLFLGHDSEPTEPKYKGHWTGCVNAEGFEYADNCHGNAAKERQQARFELCQNGQLAEIAQAITQAQSALGRIAELTEYDTPGHQITYLAKELAVKE